MIKILHLYYDLLNLYGEQGNILALKESFKRQNIKVQVDLLTINDKIDINKYDIIYLGCGSINNLMIALEDIKRLKTKLTNYINNNKYIIATGNSYLLFGEKIDDKECLKIFNYYAITKPKDVSESLMELPGQKDIIGFQNRRYVVNNNSNHLFKVKKGLGDNYKSTYEGYREKNFIGTYLIGPLLIRNPHFTNLIVKDILEKKNYIYHKDEIKILNDAYNNYIKNFYNE